MGIYECRWNNSRGEARKRNFVVSVTFAEEIFTKTVTAILIGLLAVGIGIGVKFYLDKVLAIVFSFIRSTTCLQFKMILRKRRKETLPKC
jgi:preprotein translocase subunit SecF